ncbi:C6 zinc finger domain protein [Metarhizium album ARSEF 1941]|uniref:C6 zinc finger domain protein n=1 Tax=Metarhizium album (strain ARSEF 1941) TaxID=1081103 RepID=A0A0B2WVT5_METAS|nr:C6 zinc finger domain protein [Metarhizium album ARSEF 1941]KHN97025.1 C6 zinc finger domain protein [Metarhizium album ARSEF 1941]
MTSFPIAKRKRATRAKFAKVRTGRRHVKCDETKPACKNCIKWAGFCGGYEPILAQSKTSVKQTVLTPPSPEFDSTSSPEELELPLYDSGWQFQLPENLSPPELIDSQLSSYGWPSCPTQPTGPHFSVPAACPTFDDTFWALTLPQLVQENLAIRYANVAVHVLLLAKGPTVVGAGNVIERDHYGEALSSYGRALQEARRATTGYTDLRETAVCCMFFVIFEAINGDREAAQAHLHSGQKILEEISPEYNGVQGFRKELRNVLRYLAQQARGFALDGAHQYGGDEGGSILDTLMV